MTTQGETQAVTALFVPGNRPERFEKAVRSGADAVIIDLEDAVSPEDRAAARENVKTFLAGGAWPRVWVRINGAETSDHTLDLNLLADLVFAGTQPAAVVLAKAENPGDIDRVVAASGVPTVALVESVRGYAAARALAAAVAPAGRLAFGAIDFALDAGTSAAFALDTVAFELVVASRLAGIEAPLGSPTPIIRDLGAIQEAARHAADLGLGGVLCIHPAQLEPTDRAFQPTADELAWAQRVAGAGTSAVQIDGQMIDVPVVERARRMLERASRHDAPLDDATSTTN